jgi:S1-C subfamily serine protease
MVRLSGQQGVPVITVDDSVVVGFDRPRLEQLLSSRKVKQVELGASVGDALPRVQMEGAYVGRVKNGSPAQKAGLAVRDVIVELDGQPVASVTDLRRILSGLRAGTKVRAIYVRGGQLLSADLDLG